MIETLIGFKFDWPEFLLGIALGWVIAFVVRINLSRLSENPAEIKERVLTYIDQQAGDVAERYIRELVARAQRMHLAGGLVRLSELAVPPKILLPPRPTIPGGAEVPEDERQILVPNLPDWTILCEIYHTGSLTIDEVIGKGSGLLLTGPLGSGKTTTLAYLASKYGRRYLTADSGALPLLAHVSDLGPISPKRDPAAPILQALKSYLPTIVAQRLPHLVHEQLQAGRAILLLDGLDEVGYERIAEVAAWLQQLQGDYRGTWVVAAGPVRGYDGLTEAGLAPVAMAPWEESDRQAFMAKWSAFWQKHVLDREVGQAMDELEMTLISGWFGSSDHGLNPLEFTLRAWAGFAQDSESPAIIDCLEAHVRRIIPAEERPAIEAQALQWLNTQHLTPVEAENGHRNPVEIVARTISKPHGPSTINHPALLSYLGARAMLKEGPPDLRLFDEWPPMQTALIYYAAIANAGEIVDRFLSESGDPLASRLLQCARWLREAPAKAKWRSAIFRRLSQIVQDDSRAYGLRLRAISAFVRANDPSAGVLFRQMLSWESGESRALAALALGGLRDGRGVRPIQALLTEDEEPRVRQAAAMALAAIGSELAIDILKGALTGASGEIRLMAAEGLAIAADEGHEILHQAMRSDDPWTRRAAAFGLSRVSEPWAKTLLMEAQLEETDWLVRNAIAESLDRKQQRPAMIPRPITEPAEHNWLVEFAEREGLGIAPGQLALEALQRAAGAGSLDEHIAAIEAMGWTGAEMFELQLTLTAESPQPRLRDAAFEALWRLRAARAPSSGDDSPRPSQENPEPY
jgi:hypothetical protein